MTPASGNQKRIPKTMMVLPARGKVRDGPVAARLVLPFLARVLPARGNPLTPAVAARPALPVLADFIGFYLPNHASGVASNDGERRDVFGDD